VALFLHVESFSTARIKKISAPLGKGQGGSIYLG